MEEGKWFEERITEKKQKQEKEKEMAGNKKEKGKWFEKEITAKKTEMEQRKEIEEGLGIKKIE